MKIVIPLDGSSFAEEVLAPARRLVASQGAQVHLVSVVKESDVYAHWVTLLSKDYALSREPWWTKREIPQAWAGPENPGPLAKLKEQLVKGVSSVAEKYLARVARELFPEGAATAVILADDPAVAIIDYARDHEAELIVMASHGRVGIARLLKGSVAHQLVRSGVAPLFLVFPDSTHHQELQAV